MVTSGTPSAAMGRSHIRRVESARAAFTLIEVLVVVAIIALLVAILLPSLSRARAQAKQVVCGSNVHQQCLGFFLYAADYKGTLPPNPTQGRFDPTQGRFVKSSPLFYVNGAGK